MGDGADFPYFSVERKTTGMDLIESKLDQIQLLCAKHRVKNLFVFGSVLRETFSSTSDVDFLVDFNRINASEYADNYFDLKEGLEALLHRSVDLLEEHGLRNPYVRRQVELEKRLVYGK